MRPLTCCLLSLGLSATTLAYGAHGEVTKPSKSQAPPKEQPREWSVGGGLLGLAGADFLDKLSDRTVTGSNGATYSVPDLYPGFGGMTAGGGAFVEGRYLGFIGLEIDLIRSADRGQGEISFTHGTARQKYKINIGQSSWHLPILVKATVPLPDFRPSIFAGPEFVFPGSASAKSSPDSLGLSVDAKAESYTMFTGGIGFEFPIPIKGVDMRVPLSLRGGYNLSTSSKLQDRADFAVNGGTISGVTYKSEWKYQTIATVGVSLFY